MKRGKHIIYAVAVATLFGAWVWAGNQPANIISDQAWLFITVVTGAALVWLTSCFYVIKWEE